MKVMTGKQINETSGSLLVSRVHKYTPQRTQGGKYPVIHDAQVTLLPLEVRVWQNDSDKVGRADQRLGTFGDPDALLGLTWPRDPYRHELPHASDVFPALLASGASATLKSDDLFEDHGRDNWADGELFVVFEPDDIRCLIERLTALL